MIKCGKRPDVKYIGEAKQQLRQHLMDIITKINSKTIYVPVGEHFFGPNHSCVDMKVHVLNGNIMKDDTHTMVEQKFIRQKTSSGQLINKDFGFITHYL